MVAENKPLFQLGRVVATTDAIAALEKANESAMPFIQRHHHGDWGNLCDDDKKINNKGLKLGNRLLSTYTLEATGQEIWVITEADRSVTTILLPENY